jgi:hypothetical protein
MPRGVYERKPDRYPRLKQERPFERCSAPGCVRDATRRGPRLCEKHFSRIRRGRGLADPMPPKGRYSTTDGYVRVLDRDHPLADKRGKLLEHRKVYYDRHGAGPFNCHWCGKEVIWATLHIDHVNDVKDDNDLTNLVASCGPCNTMRGFHKSLASNRARGLNLTFRGETLHASVWAERLGIRKESLKNRLAKGWPLERALTVPRGKHGPRQAP